MLRLFKHIRPVEEFSTSVFSRLLLYTDLVFFISFASVVVEGCEALIISTSVLVPTMSQMRLEQLFKRCDTKGTGFIDEEEFRELCAGFEIGNEDADVIFADLDHDGDGRISFEDFSFGFRDFLTPGAKRGSTQLSQQNHDSLCGITRQESMAKQQEMEEKHFKARSAWRHLADNLSNDDIKKFLSVR